MQDALLSNDPLKAGNLLLKSHESLRDDFEVSCPEIDHIIESSKKLEFFHGGRIMGGGFGGNMICLINENSIDLFKDFIDKECKKMNCMAMPINSVTFSDGADIVDINSVRY